MSARGSLWLIPALPLLGAALNLFVGKRLGRSAGIVASVLVAASFAVSLAVVGSLLGLGAQAKQQGQAQTRLQSFDAGQGRAGQIELRLDPLRRPMILVVTGIVADPSTRRLHARDPALRAFLRLHEPVRVLHADAVLGQNLLILYLGWEGLGSVRTC
jgi:NADH-quinone oxidoreductase subunit L